MTPFVFFAVLGAALMHASWNAIIKSQAERFTSITLTTFGMAVCASVFLPFVAVPNATAALWIVASVVTHTGYRIFLVRAYDRGDFAQTYPIARGTAPLLTTLAAIVVATEIPGSLTLLGICLLSLGTFLMSRRGGAGSRKTNPAATANALITSVFIAGYTLSDGLGARSAVDAGSYAVWLFLCDGICALLLGFALRGRQLLVSMRSDWHLGVTTGGLSAASYGIAMWAMTKAPIAAVAALRETSILFAMIISVALLGESMTRWRVVAALFIAVGMIVLRIG